MDRRETVTLTNMCMITDGTKVLVEEKKLPNGTGITFPGGHIEKNESVYDSVIREIREETGLEIKHPKYCGIKEWIDGNGYRYIVYLFSADTFTGELSSSKEGKVFWKERSELLNLPYIWHLDKMLEVFEDDRYFEVKLDEQNGYRPYLL